MAYIITEPCIGTKDKSCVDVCPVDCIHGKDEDEMLYIDPEVCIDCGVCEPECPIEAIKADTETGLEQWLTLNAEYARKWPNITQKGAPPADAKEWEGVERKFETQFSDKSGQGS